MGAACCFQNKKIELEIKSNNGDIIDSDKENEKLDKIKKIQKKYKCCLAKNKLNLLFVQEKEKIMEELDKKKLVNLDAVQNSKSEKYYHELLLGNKIKSFSELIDSDEKLKTQLKSIEKYSFSIPHFIVTTPNEVYKGSWNSNKKYHGYGVVYEFNNEKGRDSKTEGIYIDGFLSGYGRIILSNEEILTGDFLDNKLNGQGEYHRNDGSIYKGTFLNGLPHGSGKEIFIDGSSFDGFYLSGEKKYGKYSWKDGSYYQGDFDKDLFNGLGIYFWGDNKKYDGCWKEGKMNGKGKLNNSDNSYYDGEFLNGKKHGFGKYTWNNNTYYIGNWKEDKQNGYGIFCKNGKKMKGLWCNGNILTNSLRISSKNLKSNRSSNTINNFRLLLGELDFRKSNTNPKYCLSQTSSNFKSNRKAKKKINDDNSNEEAFCQNFYSLTETANQVKTSKYKSGKFG